MLKEVWQSMKDNGFFKEYDSYEQFSVKEEPNPKRREFLEWFYKESEYDQKRFIQAFGEP